MTERELVFTQVEVPSLYQPFGFEKQVKVCSVLLALAFTLTLLAYLVDLWGDSDVRTAENGAKRAEFRAGLMVVVVLVVVELVVEEFDLIWSDKEVGLCRKRKFDPGHQQVWKPGCTPQPEAWRLWEEREWVIWVYW
jgi:hypothetical protein